MTITIRLSLAALGLGFIVFGGPASASELIPPFKVRVHFGFDVQCLNQPCPSAPWWAYFPQPEHHAPVAGPTFPNWPAPFPEGDGGMARRPSAAPTFTRGYVPLAVQPAGWRSTPAPSYWYGR